jgi:SAM-dependent methyltransferase
MAAWYENDDFWETWAPYLFSQARLRNASGEVDQIIELLQLAPDASLLDFCCGVGRHCLEFARRGYAVTGVDRTRAYLAAKDLARRAARRAICLLPDGRHQVVRKATKTKQITAAKMAAARSFAAGSG